MFICKPTARRWLVNMLLSVDQAANSLQQGRIVAYPTEAVYGLGCDPFNQQAVAALWQLKQRPAAMGVIVVGASWEQLVPFMDDIAITARAQLTANWPGAFTWVVPAAKTVPMWLTGGRDTIALRWSAHEATCALCRAFGGAIVSTSANLHGQPVLNKVNDIAQQFADSNTFSGVMVGDLGGYDRPTPIRDLRSGQWVRQ